MLQKLLTHLKSAVTGPSGRVSSSRCMLIATSVYAMVVLAIVLHHLLNISDPAMLASWTSILQVLGSVLAALAGLPYACGKVTGGLGEIVAAIKGKGRE